MNMNGKIRLIAAVFLIFPIVGGCARPGIPITYLVPPASKEAMHFRKVAITPMKYGDQYGRQDESGNFREQVEAALASVKVNGEQYFTVSEREHTDQVLREIQWTQASGLFSNQQALKLGKFLGVQGIYTGTVYAPVVNRSHFWQTHSDYRDCHDGKCHRREYDVRCVKLEASFSFTPKLIDVERNQVVYSNNLGASATDEACEDSQRPLKSPGELLAEAQGAVLQQFIKDVAPTYETQRVALMDADGSVTSAIVQQKLAQGMQFAQGGRMDRACEYWREAYAMAQWSVALNYNLGVCAESAGNLPEALGFYQKADKLLTAPNSDVTEALARISAAMNDQQTFRRHAN